MLFLTSFKTGFPNDMKFPLPNELSAKNWRILLKDLQSDQNRFYYLDALNREKDSTPFIENLVKANKSEAKAINHFKEKDFDKDHKAPGMISSTTIPSVVCMIVHVSLDYYSTYFTSYHVNNCLNFAFSH